MTITGREKAMAAITIMVLMYGVLGLLAKGRLEAWRVKRGETDLQARRVAQEQKLISLRSQWEKNYAGVRNLMIVFPTGTPVDTYWLTVMEDAARNNGVKILKRQANPEKLVGDVYEIAIECKEWEASLDQLVHFLYALETKGVMLDMRQMFIRPHPQNRLLLRGSFTLYCAYMREKPASAAGAKTPVAAGVTKPPAKVVSTKPPTATAVTAKPATTKSAVKPASRPLPLPPPPKKK